VPPSGLASADYSLLWCAYQQGSPAAQEQVAKLAGHMAVALRVMLPQDAARPDALPRPVLQALFDLVALATKVYLRMHSCSSGLCVAVSGLHRQYRLQSGEKGAPGSC
jgi:hypothetical protein